MSSRSFEIWVITAPLNKLLFLREAYINHMTPRKLKELPIEPWLTENLELINERIAAFVRASEGLDPVHPAAGPDV